MPRIRKIKACSRCLNDASFFANQVRELKGKFLHIKTDNPASFNRSSLRKHLTEAGTDGIVTDHRTEIVAFTDEQLLAIGLKRI